MNHNVGWRSAEHCGSGHRELGLGGLAIGDDHEEPRDVGPEPNAIAVGKDDGAHRVEATVGERPKEGLRHCTCGLDHCRRRLAFGERQHDRRLL